MESQNEKNKKEVMGFFNSKGKYFNRIILFERRKKKCIVQVRHYSVQKIL